MNFIDKWLDGKKTLIGGIGGIIAAVGYFLTQGLSDGLQGQDVIVLLTAISASLGLLGLGGKLQKLVDALKK